MPETKVVYQEKCIIEAKNEAGRIYSRELSLVAKESGRKIVQGKAIICVEAEFKNGLKTEKESICVSDLKFLRDYFLRKLSSLIDLVHPEKRLKITFPSTNKYLKMRRAYCQNCGAFVREFYGFYEGRIEKCSHCSRLTVFKRNPKES